MAKSKAVPSVFLLFIQDGTLLMARRQNTGHMDGMVGLPSGKVEEGEVPVEAAVREALEEVGVAVRFPDLRLVHIQYHSQPQDQGGDYINFYYIVDKWFGELRNAEPEMCSEILFVELARPIRDIIPYVGDAICFCILEKFSFSTYRTH